MCNIKLFSLKYFVLFNQMLNVFFSYKKNLVLLKIDFYSRALNKFAAILQYLYLDKVIFRRLHVYEKIYVNRKGVLII